MHTVYPSIEREIRRSVSQFNPMILKLSPVKISALISFFVWLAGGLWNSAIRIFCIHFLSITLKLVAGMPVLLFNLICMSICQEISNIAALVLSRSIPWQHIKRAQF